MHINDLDYRVRGTIYHEQIIRDGPTNTTTGVYLLCTTEYGYPIYVTVLTHNVYVDYIYINEYDIFYFICRNKSDNSLYMGKLSFVVVKYWDNLGL